MVSFLASICAIWVFPHPNLFANCLALCACCLDARITSTFSSWQFCFVSSFKGFSSFLGFLPLSVFFFLRRKDIKSVSQITSHHMICSVHFQGGLGYFKADPVPTIYDDPAMALRFNTNTTKRETPRPRSPSVEVKRKCCDAKKWKWVKGENNQAGNYMVRFFPLLHFTGFF